MGERVYPVFQGAVLIYFFIRGVFVRYLYGIACRVKEGEVQEVPIFIIKKLSPRISFFRRVAISIEIQYLAYSPIRVVAYFLYGVGLRPAYAGE